MIYDVVIVGAGPAGATAAKNLAEQNISVLLIDKRKFPADKPCGGGLPTRVQQTFPYISDFIDSISYGSKTFSMSKQHTFNITRDTPVIATVLRKHFDYELVKLAQKSGAKLQTETTVHDIKINDKNATVILEDGKEITTKIIIGADGAHSKIAEKTHLRKPHQPICRCLVTEEPMTEKQIEKHFSKKRDIHLFIKLHGIAGYGWVFPKKSHISIGIGEFETALTSKNKRSKLTEVFDAYIQDLKKMDLLPKSFKISNLKGANLPIFPLEKTYTDRVILCGDAAGFINPITGEGIYFAMESGVIAAEIIQKALEQNRFDETILSTYQDRWTNDFGKDLKLLGRFNKLWGKESEKIVRLLTKDKVFAKLMVGVTGGSISAAEYKNKIILRYLWVLIKDKFTRNK
jgi:geranylgeranyl reductase family protein